MSVSVRNSRPTSTWAFSKYVHAFWHCFHFLRRLQINILNDLVGSQRYVIFTPLPIQRALAIVHAAYTRYTFPLRHKSTSIRNMIHIMCLCWWCIIWCLTYNISLLHRWRGARERRRTTAKKKKINVSKYFCLKIHSFVLRSQKWKKEKEVFSSCMNRSVLLVHIFLIEFFSFFRPFLILIYN